MRDLVRSAQQGDSAAETEVFRRLHVRFLLLAKRRIGNDFAEDVVQDACATVFEKYRTGLGEQEFEPWAYEILRNKIGNFLQRNEVRRRLSATVHSHAAAGAPSDPDLRSRLLDCLRRLIRFHSRYARVLNLVHQGYRTEEICERLGVSANNLYVLLNRGRRLLRDCLKRGRK